MVRAYSGDVTPREAYEILRDQPNAVLVDVRTAAEWQFAGIPALQELGKQVILIEWTYFPSGTPNPDFVAQVSQSVGDGDPTVLFLCRSGVRSQGAAAALTQHGYTKCLNILEGFEGDKDHNGHRGQTGGWKQAGLPWIQG